MDNYLSSRLFFKITKLVNESNTLSLAEFGFYLTSEKFVKI